ncbi:MAG: phosphatase PAP2 family protein [Myxococcota bacterium]|nr:phosphatase PAP2 family protein [Myxococcota bacterium]
MSSTGNPFLVKVLVRRIGAGMSLVDTLTLVFFGYFLCRFSLVGESMERQRAMLGFLSLLVTFCSVLVLVRGQLIQSSRFRGVLYRLTLFLVHAGAFIFFFRDALICLQPALLDSELASIDRLIFGVVPAHWSVQFNSIWLTEYLSFFYLTHFIVVIYAVGPTLVTGSRDPSAVSLTTGALMLIIAGWIVYTWVPAMGPYQTMDFPRPLHGGVFYALTMDAVDQAGPLLDVFPSLHSAFTFFVALQVNAYARDRFTKRMAVLFFFIDFNIVLATIYLRFHYAIDVIAGLVLAGVVHRVSLGYRARLLVPSREKRAQPVFADSFSVDS